MDGKLHVIAAPQNSFLHDPPLLHLPGVKRTVILYGVAAALVVLALRLIEFRFLVIEHSLEIYGGLVAFLFAGLGIWLGQRLARPTERVVVQEVVVSVPAPPVPFVANRDAIDRSGLTPRELEILTLIAEGLSNREIGERLFVSENTVKTHSANLFSKLGARRRIQAVQFAKDAGIIP